jgi:hypothetical protein
MNRFHQIGDQATHEVLVEVQRKTQLCRCPSRQSNGNPLHLTMLSRLECDPKSSLGGLNEYAISRLNAHYLVGLASSNRNILPS